MDKRDVKLPSQVHFVLLGKTGSGKSASGNTILGREAFLSKNSSNAVTRDVQIGHGDIRGLPVTVYDTPGIFDSRLSDEKIREKYQSVLDTCESEYCVFLLVIRTDRFTEEERNVVDKIEKLLGENRLKKTWILFTRRDELEKENQTIEHFIKKTPELKKLVEKYQNRYHVFNNKEKNNGSQVLSLLRTVIDSSPLGSKLKRIKKEVPENSLAASERRLVLLGKAGVGKSASGNTILGQKCFKSDVGMKVITETCHIQTAQVAGRTVSVIDTPGLFDTDMEAEPLITEAERSICLSGAGPHAFLIVLSLRDRFTRQELQVIQTITLMFGQETEKYSVILFTNGDCLEEKTVEDLIKEKPALRELVQRCGGRSHVFNNKDQRNRQQVTELLEQIDRMVEENGGSCYSNEMFEDAQRCRQKEERMEEENLRESQTTDQDRNPSTSEKIVMLLNYLWTVWNQMRNYV